MLKPNSPKILLSGRSAIGCLSIPAKFICDGCKMLMCFCYFSVDTILARKSQFSKHDFTVEVDSHNSESQKTELAEVPFFCLTITIIHFNLISSNIFVLLAKFQ